MEFSGFRFYVKHLFVMCVGALHWRQGHFLWKGGSRRGASMLLPLSAVLSCRDDEGDVRICLPSIYAWNVCLIGRLIDCVLRFGKKN